MIFVSLVGEFFSNIVPLFYEFKNKIKYNILLYREKNKEQAFYIEDGLQKLANKYKLSISFCSFRIDEDNPSTIKNAFNFIIKNNKGEDIYLNLSDGNAAEIVFITKLFSKENIKFIAYDKYEDKYIIIEKNSIKRFKPLKSLSIYDHLLAKGFTILDYRTIDQIKGKSKDIQKIMSNFTLYQKIRNLEAIHNLEDEELEKSLKKLNIIDNRGLIIDKQYLTGGIFEDYVALTLNSLDIEEMVIGAKILFKRENLTNEFDILFMKSNHLHVIECKTGKLSLLPTLESLIYKYSSLISVLDDDSKAMIIHLGHLSENEKIGFYEKSLRANLLRVGFIALETPNKVLLTKFLCNFFNLKKKK